MIISMPGFMRGDLRGLYTNLMNLIMKESVAMKIWLRSTAWD
jgi:hypothetical protein